MAARELMGQILEWDFNKLVLAHGPVVRDTARETVELAFPWLNVQANVY